MGFLERLLGGNKSGDFPDSPLERALKLTSEGNYYGERGNLDHAIKCFKEAISIHRGHVPAHIALSTAYREKGEYQRALDVLSESPSESDAGDEPVDFAFEIAYAKAGVLIAKYQRSGFRGSMPDLLSALEKARRLGEQPLQEHRHYSSAAKAFGVDLVGERREKLAMIDEMLTEIRGG